MSARPAKLTGARLFDLEEYPMACEAPGGEVWGEILNIAPDRYAAAIEVLDRLEGVPDGLFHRASRLVEGESSVCVQAWVYFGRPDLALRGRLIGSGDWKKRFETEDKG